MTLYENIEAIEKELRDRILLTDNFDLKERYLTACLQFRKYRMNLSIEDANTII